MTDDEDNDNSELEKIAEQFAEAQVSKGYLKDECRAEKGEEFGYE